MLRKSIIPKFYRKGPNILNMLKFYYLDGKCDENQRLALTFGSFNPPSLLQ